METPLDSLNLAAGAEALPLELLQPLDSNNPASTPVSLSGPGQRPLVTPDPGVMGGDGDGSWLPPSRLLIGKDGATRSIWPVHLAGWQALGWQLLSPANGGEEPVPLDTGDNAPETAPTPDQPTDFQAMTKAQIVEFCSTVYGVELDGSQTKAELVEQAMVLELGDALL